MMMYFTGFNSPLLAQKINEQPTYETQHTNNCMSVMLMGLWELQA